MNDFRTAMRGLCQSIGIVTTCNNGRFLGMTATSIASVSMDPPSVLICINSGASIHPAISQSGRFNINFLSDEQEDLSRVFSSAISNEMRFQHGQWAAAEGSPPSLRGAYCVVSCELESASTFATHTIFIGRVSSVSLEKKGLPLVYFNGGYHALEGANQAVGA